MWTMELLVCRADRDTRSSIETTHTGRQVHVRSTHGTYIGIALHGRRGSRPLYAMQRPAMDGVLHLNLLVPTQVLRRGLVDAPGGSIRALGQ